MIDKQDTRKKYIIAYDSENRAWNILIWMGDLVRDQNTQPNLRGYSYM